MTVTMPAYFWVQLYKSTHEMAPDLIVEQTVQGLTDAGCQYQHIIRSVIDDSFGAPRDGSRLVRVEQVPLDKAIKFAIQDIIADDSEGRRQYRSVPETRLVFTYDFLFDPDQQYDPGIADLVREVRVNFWRRYNPNVGPYINISIDTWEEYVLLYGKPETHQQNLQSIINIAMSVAELVTPYYGWMDNESSSYDISHEDLLNSKWPNGNEFIFVGPQMLSRIAAYPDKQHATLNHKLKNGGRLFRHRHRTAAP